MGLRSVMRRRVYGNAIMNTGICYGGQVGHCLRSTNVHDTWLWLGKKLLRMPPRANYWSVFGKLNDVDACFKNMKSRLPKLATTSIRIHDEMKIRLEYQSPIKSRLNISKFSLREKIVFSFKHVPSTNNVRSPMQLAVWQETNKISLNRFKLRRPRRIVKG